MEWNGIESKSNLFYTNNVVTAKIVGKTTVKNNGDMKESGTANRRRQIQEI